MGDTELAEELSFQVVFCQGKETGQKVPGPSDRGSARAPQLYRASRRTAFHILKIIKRIV